MPVHIGKIIQEAVEQRRLTHKEFGALINKNEKTVPDIYNRASMSIDLLLAISEALHIDLLNIYYTEEPLKSLRHDEVAKLNDQIQKVTEENNRLHKELTLMQSLSEALKETVSFAKEQIAGYKTKLKEYLDPDESDNILKEAAVEYLPER